MLPNATNSIVNYQEQYWEELKMNNIPCKNWAIRGPVYRILRFLGVETCCITAGPMFIDRASIAASETKKFNFNLH